VSDFIVRLHESPATPVTNLAFEWLILTAARSGETRGATWTEIDEAKKLWTIPKRRMKAGGEHIVPLSGRCLDIAKQAKALNPRCELFFPATAREALSDLRVAARLHCAKSWHAALSGSRSAFR